METGTSEHEELNEDFLLALKLSEGVDQFSLPGCINHELDEDFLLALKLSEESDPSGLGCGNGCPELDEDLLLALKLSEGFDQSAGGIGQLESNAAFARRLERELKGGEFPEEPKDESSMISSDTSANVAILREWYAGSQGQASKLADLFQHLNFLDDVMLLERSGLRLITKEVKVAPNRFNRQTDSISPRPSRTGFSSRFISISKRPRRFQPPKTHDPEVDRKTSAAFDFVSTNLNGFTGDIGIGQGRRVSVRSIMSAMLDLSLFSETTEMFLRSDSIKDLGERLGLVKSLLGLLKAMSLRDEYRSILTRPRRLKKHTKGLMGIAQSPLGTAVTSVIVLEDEKEPKSQPLFDLLGRLKLQAEVYLKGARSSNDGAFRFGEGAVSASLCEYLVEVHDSMLKTIEFVDSPINSPGKGKGGMFWSSRSSTTVIAPLNESLSKIPKTLDWSFAILDTHHFKQDAQQIVNPVSGRLPKLVRQITELTNLPEGIFVRVMEARPDVLKALIVGPKDTPYEGGLFEFDILAPRDFPNSPPNIVFKTTSGGRVRFNPNLYADGKVCLSLVNTWPGNGTEKWMPESSTLLQVLISIQSMIFVECPYTNEPGREGHADQLESYQHKEFVRANTIRWAMVDWLQDYSKRNGIWKDVVRAHFLRNASQLRQLVRNSAANNVGIWHYHGNNTEDTLVRCSSGGINLEKELDRCLSLLN